MIRIDPRTKLILLVLTTLATAFSPNIYYELGLIGIIMVFGILSGKFTYSIGMLIGYGVVMVLAIINNIFFVNGLHIMVCAFVDIFNKMFPCVMLGGILVMTTKVNEFMEALNKMHIPKNLIISLTVLIRYIPIVKEDWHAIKDSMRMRDVSPNILGLIKSPANTIECAYVPLMTAASKAVDDLTAAAITRGIEMPKRRTSLIQIKFRYKDLIIGGVFIMYFIIAFYM